MTKNLKYYIALMVLFSIVLTFSYSKLIISGKATPWWAIFGIVGAILGR